MAGRLAREEGLLCGPSSGMNVVAALKVAAKHPEFHRIVTVDRRHGAALPLRRAVRRATRRSTSPTATTTIDAETLERVAAHRDRLEFLRMSARMTSSYPLSPDEDPRRSGSSVPARFVDDELIPWEVHAEEHEGLLPEETRERHHRMAIELGFSGMNMPKDIGGGGMTMLQQTLVSEQLGRVTNALGWCVHTPPAWAPAVVTPEQLERWIVPTVRGERHECYAITEEGAGSDVDAIASTVRRDGDELRAERREDARDVVQHRELLLLPGQDRRR